MSNSTSSSSRGGVDGGGGRNRPTAIRSADKGGSSSSSRPSTMAAPTSASSSSREKLPSHAGSGANGVRGGQRAVASTGKNGTPSPAADRHETEQQQQQRPSPFAPASRTVSADKFVRGGPSRTTSSGQNGDRPTWDPPAAEEENASSTPTPAPAPPSKTKRFSFKPEQSGDDFLRLSEPTGRYEGGPSYTKFRDATSVDPVDALADMAQPIWVRDPSNYSTDLAQMFNQEVEDYVRYISPTQEEHEMRMLTIERMRVTVLSLYPRAEVMVFGSFETKLYLPTSDIDVVLIDPRIQPPGCLFKIAAKLSEHNIVSKIEVVDKARVPIIKYTDALTKFAVDISVNVETGPEAARIVTQFVEDPKLGLGIRGLMYVMKQFLLQRHLNEPFTGGLGSYGLLILVSSFLMMHPMIQCGKLQPEENLGILVLEFLQVYGKCFNFAQVGIGVDIENGTWYFRKENVYWLKRKMGLLTILDPQDKTNDVGSGSYNFHQVRSEFQRAYTRIVCMIGATYERNRQSVAGARNGTSNSETNPSVRPNSILGAFLSVPKDLFAVREHSQLLADKVRKGLVETGVPQETWDKVMAASSGSPLAHAGTKRKRDWEHRGDDGGDDSPLPTPTRPSAQTSTRNGQPQPARPQQRQQKPTQPQEQSGKKNSSPPQSRREKDAGRESWMPSTPATSSGRLAQDSAEKTPPTQSKRRGVDLALSAPPPVPTWNDRDTESDMEISEGDSDTGPRRKK
ncbi:hypothetical protein DFJ73DRAFT_820944 [Zopfochytrium polystomum]|nr:hypothetical protein DFJ73DRAFT_820944 [Zopfochytrium polystomum]